MVHSGSYHIILISLLLSRYISTAHVFKQMQTQHNTTPAMVSMQAFSVDLNLSDSMLVYVSVRLFKN